MYIQHRYLQHKLADRKTVDDIFTTHARAIPRPITKQGSRAIPSEEKMLSPYSALMILDPSRLGDRAIMRIIDMTHIKFCQV